MKKKYFLRSPVFKILIKFGLTATLLDIYWGKNNKKKWDKIKKSGFIEKPTSIWYEPTMRCNLNCKFCHQSERRKIFNKEMNINEIEKFLTDAKEMGIERIEMIGGEIFVRKDIFDILDIIESKKMKVKLGTNGILLNKERVEKLKKYKSIESISISIDGPPEIHNSIRNFNFAYQKAIEALKLLAQNSFQTVIYSVLLPENLETSEFLILLACDLKVDRLTFMPEMFYSDLEIKKSRKYLQLMPNEKIFVERREVKDIEEYTEKVINTINKIKILRRRYATFVPIFPRIASKYPKEFLLNKIYQKKQLICKHFYSLTIIENGDVLICPFIHKKVGNVTKSSIKEIWNNEIMKDLRRKILEKNLLPICRRCCSIDYI